MVNEDEAVEGVTLCYQIESADFNWLKKNISKFLESYDRMRDNGAYVEAWIHTYPPDEPCIYYKVKGNGRCLESVLEILFSERGLPYAVKRPGKLGRTKQGFKIAENLINNYGRKLKTKLDGGFVQKIVD
jgi:hypothetical protein